VRERIDLVVLGGAVARLPPFDELTATCLDLPLRITEVSDFYEDVFGMCRLGRSMRPGSCILPTPTRATRRRWPSVRWTWRSRHLVNQRVRSLDLPGRTRPARPRRRRA
jgi:hypothetical protein